MAWIVGDGFDCYAGASTTELGGVWVVTGTILAFVSGLSTPYGVGQALSSSGVSSGSIRKDFTNEPTVFVALQYWASDTGKVSYLHFRDGATPQCSVVFEVNGSITLRSGSETGTVLATYGSAFTLSTWAHFQIRVVVHNTTGSITVRKNGATTDSFTATGLNTRGGTANNYANAVLFGFLAGTSGSVFRYVDDLLIYSGSGAAPNDWIGIQRALTLPPVADVQTQFTATPTTTYAQTPSATTGKSVVADTIYWGEPLTPAKSGTVVNVTVKVQVALTGTLQMALYANDGPGKQPGTLVSTFPPVVNPGVGDLVLTPPAGLTLTAGLTYYVAALANGAWTTNYRPVTTGYRVASAAAGGFPAMAPTVLTADGAQAFWAGFTLTGSVTTVSEVKQNGDTDYVFGSTVNLEDLYAIAAVPLGQPVLAVQTRAFVRNTDATTRRAQVRVVSGGTDFGGADAALTTTYIYLLRTDPVDPATSAPWTVAAVNAVQVGVKITV